MKTRVAIAGTEDTFTWPDGASPARCLSQAVENSEAAYDAPHDGAWLEFS